MRMSMKVDVKVDTLRAVRMREELRDTVWKGGNMLLDKVRQDVPVRTGELKTSYELAQRGRHRGGPASKPRRWRSWAPLRGGVNAVVGSQQFYAPWVERSPRGAHFRQNVKAARPEYNRLIQAAVERVIK